MQKQRTVLPMIDYDNIDCKEHTITNVRFGHSLIPKMSVFIPKKKKELDLNKKLLVDTPHLQELLDCGKKSAIEIGHRAGACVKLERKLFWNVRLVQKYVDDISE